MAYAEKRGKGPTPWRVKYKLPSGLEASESGFETKAAALAWGRSQESKIREGRWTDPNAGKITLGEWIDRWLPLQDVGISTEENREYLIRRFIRPAWGVSELGSLSTEEITKWENGLPARYGVGRRCAADARSLLCTILGDAAATKPPLIPYNPAIRPRNRGRRTGRRLARAPQRVWATPLQALLVAERAALLTGRDDDLTMVVTIAYTGCAGVRRSAWSASTHTPVRSTSSGSFGSSGAPSTGSRPRTTPTAARPGNLACRSTSRRSWRGCSPARSRTGRGSHALALPSMAGPVCTFSSARTAVTIGAATTPAGCSAQHAMDDTNPD
jgi:hypothetical protein